MPSEVDERRVWELHVQGISQREIARQTGIPRTTVQSILKRLPQASTQVMSSASPPIDKPLVQSATSEIPSGKISQVYEGVPQVALMSIPKVHHDTSPLLSAGTSEVHLDVPLLRELGTMWPDLTTMVGEWRARKAIRHREGGSSRATQLKTYHVEKRHIDRIAMYAKEVGLSQSDIVNEAIRRFFESG
jgi:hypothetical protein